MKKFIFIVIIIAILVFAFLYKKDNKTQNNQNGIQTEEVNQDQDVKDVEDADNDEDEDDDDDDADDNDETEDYEEVKPAIDEYSSAKEAMDAILVAAKEGNDEVIEQFHMLSNCEWCNEVYDNLKNLMVDKSINPDERGFYAELLATTGKKENIEALVEAAKSSTEPEDVDIFTEAIELSDLSIDATNYLKDVFTSATNEELKESTIAAISNQGTKESIETLYDITVANGDTNGFYDKGTGLGEVVPDAAALPLLEDIANKKDGYSHLAIKALLNGGNDGTKKVLDLLGASASPAEDIKLFDLEEAAEHVLYDDTTKTIFDSIQNPNEAQKYLIEKVVEISKNDEGEEE